MATILASGAANFWDSAAEGGSPMTNDLVMALGGSAPARGVLIWTIAASGQGVAITYVDGTTGWDGGTFGDSFLGSGLGANRGSSGTGSNSYNYYLHSSGWRYFEGTMPASLTITITSEVHGDTSEIDTTAFQHLGYVTWAIVDLEDDEYRVNPNVPATQFDEPVPNDFVARWGGWSLDPDDSSGTVVPILSMTDYTTLDITNSTDDVLIAGSYAQIPPYAGALPDTEQVHVGVAMVWAAAPDPAVRHWIVTGGGEGGSTLGYELIAYVPGIIEEGCVGCPPPCHIPHKRWMDRKDKAFHRENWLTVARWAAATNAPVEPPMFHAPHADLVNHDLDNWNTLERWATAWAAECDCWNVPLHIPHKIDPDPKMEEENWLAFERWTSVGCECSDASPPGA